MTNCEMVQAFVSVCAPFSTGRNELPVRQRRKSRLNEPRCSASKENLTGSQGLSRRNFLAGLSSLALSTALPKPTSASTEHFSDVVFDSRSGSFVPPSAIHELFRRDLRSSFDRCIVAGEIHDNMRTHAAQLAVIEGARRISQSDGKKLFVGFEQFYRMHDMYLDAYIAGEMTVDQMLLKTNWSQTWGYDPAMYKPIFEYCRIYGIPMRGLNIPQPFVSTVKRYGIQDLPEELKEWLPDNMDFGNRAHYNHFIQLITQGHGDVTGYEEVLKRYYEIQVLWEEWMSQSVAMTLQKHPESRIVALIGSGHVEGRFGFPDRIEKRCSERPYTIVPRPVLYKMNDEYMLPDIAHPDKGVADLVWYTRRWA